MGDGVIGSPPAFGAVQSRFESESPSQPLSPSSGGSSASKRRVPAGYARVPGRTLRDRSADGRRSLVRDGARPAAVVVLAAGEGTRMQSATPEGAARARRPQPARPRARRGRAARRRTRTLVVVGAGRDAVAGAPRPRSRPDAVPVVQEEQHGTGHAVRGRAGRRPGRSTAPSCVLPRRRPAAARRDRCAGCVDGAPDAAAPSRPC